MPRWCVLAGHGRCWWLGFLTSMRRERPVARGVGTLRSSGPLLLRCLSCCCGCGSSRPLDCIGVSEDARGGESVRQPRARGCVASPGTPGLRMRRAVTSARVWLRCETSALVWRCYASGIAFVGFRGYWARRIDPGRSQSKLGSYQYLVPRPSGKPTCLAAASTPRRPCTGPSCTRASVPATSDFILEGWPQIEDSDAASSGMTVPFARCPNNKGKRRGGRCRRELPQKIHTRRNRKQKKAKAQPLPGFEHGTFALRVRRSTTKLQWRTGMGIAE